MRYASFAPQRISPGQLKLYFLACTRSFILVGELPITTFPFGPRRKISSNEKPKGPKLVALACGTE